jgi:hypothetical protein
MNRSYNACACGTKPRRGPQAALLGAKSTIFKAINRHEREVNDFANGKESRIGPPEALPGADVRRKCLVLWRALPLRGPALGQRQHFFAGSVISWFQHKFEKQTGLGCSRWEDKAQAPRQKHDFSF